MAGEQRIRTVLLNLPLMKLFPFRTHALTSLSLLGSGIGFLSQVVLAKTLGVSVSVDAYFFALGVPIFIGGLLSAAANFTLTPKLRRLWDADRTGAAHRATSIRRLGLRTTLGLGLFGLIASPVQWHTLPTGSPILKEPSLPWLMLGSWFFAGVLVHQNLVASLLVSQDRLIRAATLPLFAPFCSCIFLLLAGQQLGVPAMLAGQIVGSGLAIFLAKLEQVVAPSQGPIAPENEISANLVLHGLGYATMAMACFTAYPLIDSVLAPRAGDHVVSQISYAQRLVIGLGNLTVAAPFAILANRFTDLASNATQQEFVRSIRSALIVSCIPSVVLALVFAYRGDLVVNLLFGRGKFTADDAKMVGLAIQWMAPGMVLMLLTTLLFRAGYALSSGTKSLGFLGLLWMASYSILGTHFLPMGVKGLAIAYSGTWFITSIAALFVVRRAAHSHFRAHKP